jgi:DNA-binding NarL/FixJ family response regulator
MTVRCVIVDDSPAVLRAARDLLERQGITVVGTAETTDEAARLIREHEPDVALIDIDLGVDSGFALARRLAACRADLRTRSILMSTRAEADYADLIAASPAVGFLAKPDLSAAAIRRLLDDPGKAIETRGT